MKFLVIKYLLVEGLGIFVTLEAWEGVDKLAEKY